MTSSPLPKNQQQQSQNFQNHPHEQHRQQQHHNSDEPSSIPHQFNSLEFYDYYESGRRGPPNAFPNSDASTTASDPNSSPAPDTSDLFNTIPTPVLFPLIPSTLLPNLFSRNFVFPPLPDTPPTPFELGLRAATESCAFKAGSAGIVGGGLGVVFGLFFGGYSNAVDRAIDTKGSTLVKMRVGMREAGAAMSSYAKNFARFGFFLSGTECTLETLRGRHDIFNPVLGGCITGAGMASAPLQSMPAKLRAQQMAIGCASLAAFSLAIEKYMEYTSS